MASASCIGFSVFFSILAICPSTYFFRQMNCQLVKMVKLGDRLVFYFIFGCQTRPKYFHTTICSSFKSIDHIIFGVVVYAA